MQRFLAKFRDSTHDANDAVTEEFFVEGFDDIDQLVKLHLRDLIAKRVLNAETAFVDTIERI